MTKSWLAGKVIRGSLALANAFVGNGPQNAVIPAQAGIQFSDISLSGTHRLDSRMRGNGGGPTLADYTNTRKSVPAAVAAAFLVLCPAVASAHPMQGVGDFYAGMLHPLTAMEFLLPMIALSLLAGQQDRASAIATLATFPAALAVGAMAGTSTHLPPIVSWINLGSMAGLGLLVAAARPLRPIVAAALSTLLGLSIGLANGAELGGQVSAYRFVPGLALAGLMLVTYGIGCVRRLRAPWMRIGFRVLGSWIAAIGILVLSLK